MEPLGHSKGVAWRQAGRCEPENPIGLEVDSGTVSGTARIFLKGGAVKVSWRVPILGESLRFVAFFSVIKQNQIEQFGTYELSEDSVGGFATLSTYPRWWQLKYFLFSPVFGEDSHFDSYFSEG